MPVGRLDHYSIRTLDIEASRRFYTEVMGFEVERADRVVVESAYGQLFLGRQ